MIIIGLTGSIGMGKSTAAKMLQKMGVPVHDSDDAVRQFLKPGGAGVAPVLARFPGVRGSDGGIDRKALARIVFTDPAQREILESILHPMVQVSQRDFIKACTRRRLCMAAFDIPLLFETGAESRVDYTIVVSAPFIIQKQRVMARGMSEAEFRARLSRQMPDVEKRRRADFVVQTGNGFAYTRQELSHILRKLKNKHCPPPAPGMG